MRHVTEQFIGNAGHRSWVKSRRRVLRPSHPGSLVAPSICTAAGPTYMHPRALPCRSVWFVTQPYAGQMAGRTAADGASALGTAQQSVYIIALHRRFEENDLPLLTKLRETMPDDTRIAFYRAHTLWAMHRFQDAYAAYDVRLNMANVSRSNPVRWRPGCVLVPHLA